MEKKGFFKKMFDKLDNKLEAKAKEGACCCSCEKEQNEKKECCKK